MKTHLAAVDVFTTPSRFMISQFVNWGLDESKFVHVTNARRMEYAGLALNEPPHARNRFGFFGQLVDAKGVQIIFEAVNLLRAEGFSDFLVEINGDNIRFASPAIREKIEAFWRRSRNCRWPNAMCCSTALTTRTS